MTDINFTKISATGNDFIVIDNRDGRFHPQRDRQFFSRLCQRRISVGADGVILLESSDIADVKYIHINADGSIAEMCGNGSRALAYFARKHGIGSPELRFEIAGNVYSARINGTYATTDFIRPAQPQFNLNIVEESEIEEGGFINTGVPHFVLFSSNIDKIDVATIGNKYCHHPVFPKGTNVDFVEIENSTLRVRTYERGVEEETLACGTGAVACAIIANIRKNIYSPVVIYQPGGILRVEFDKNYRKITLGGAVEPIYQGTLVLVT
jgi:diaminopimelate epimerase